MHESEPFNMLRYLFPNSDIEREWALDAPVRFFFRVFLKYAAVMALLLVVIESALPQSSFAARPLSRLGFVSVWAAMMSLLNLWAARYMRLRQSRM